MGLQVPNVAGGSEKEEVAQSPLAGEGWLYSGKLFAGVSRVPSLPLLAGPVCLLIQGRLKVKAKHLYSAISGICSFLSAVRHSLGQTVEEQVLPWQVLLI